MMLIKTGVFVWPIHVAGKNTRKVPGDNPAYWKVIGEVRGNAEYADLAQFNRRFWRRYGVRVQLAYPWGTGSCVVGSS